MKPIHVALKEIRKTLGMSQEEVAHALQIQTTTYSKIERGMIQLTINRLFDLAHIFNVTPEEIINYHKPNKPVSKTGQGNITYVPVHAQAGFLDHFADQTQTERFTTFNIPVFTEKDLYMISVEGDSMYPTITPGTFIIIKEVQNKSLIKWGEPHVIVTTDGRVAKRVLQSQDKTCITLFSDNKLYQPYDIPKSQILSLWVILGKISRSFAPKAYYNDNFDALDRNFYPTKG